MRLKNKPWANELVEEHPESALDRPDPAEKIDWAARFGNDKPIEIEVGSGKGQFITTLAKQHPDRNFVAMEIQKTAAGIILKKKLDEGLDNLQILCADAANLVAYFGENSTSKIYLNFSDPWPKKRHAKRRLTYRDFLKRYAVILKEGGEIRFKTDNKDLFDFSVEEFEAMGWQLSDVTYDLHAAPVPGDVETEYEEKFSRKGNLICRLVARRP